MGNGKLKILYYSKGLFTPSGGGEAAANHLLSAINELNKKQNILEIYVLTDHNNLPKSKYLFTHPTFPLNVPILKFWIDNQFASNYLAKIADEIEPDVIHIQGYSGYYPKPPKKYKSIVTFHDHPYMSIFDKKRRDILKYLEFLWYEIARNIRIYNIPKYSKYHALSTQIKSALVKYGVDENSIYTLPNGINEIKTNGTIMKPLNGKLKNKKLIMMLGKIHYRKGIHLVAQSLKFLPSEYELVLIGEPMSIVGSPYLERVLQIAPGRIHYLGYLSRREVNILFKVSSCYISASMFEACQLTPLEAIANDTTVVTSYVGAIPDIFPDDYDLVFKDDNPQNIANLIIKASNRNGNGFDKSKFQVKDWSEVAKQMVDIYQDMTNDSRN